MLFDSLFCDAVDLHAYLNMLIRLYSATAQVNIDVVSHLGYYRLSCHGFSFRTGLRIFKGCETKALVFG